MGQLNLVVKASKGTENMLRAGMFARVDIQIVDDNNSVVMTMADGILKMGQDGRVYIAPPRIGDRKTKAGVALKYWFLAREHEDTWGRYIVDQAVEQIGGIPTIPAPAGPPAARQPIPAGPAQGAPRAPMPSPAARTAPPAPAGPRPPTGPAVLGDPWAPKR